MNNSLGIFAIALCGSLTFGSAAFAAQADQVTSHIKYYDLWTDKDGIAHVNECEFKNFTLKSMKPPASPQWQDIMKAEGSKVISTVQPAGWAADWHEDPTPQFVVTLRGKWYVQSNDGKRIEMGPGDILMGEDLNTKPNAQGHIGHLSGTVGDEDSQLMVFQLKDRKVVPQPCRFQ